MTIADVVLEHPFMYSALHTVTGLRRLHGRLIEGAMRRYVDRASVRILDLGCGPGDTLNLIGEHAGYTGVDLNASYVAIAKKKSPSTALFALGDVTRLDPSRFGQYDLIICFGLVHHLDDEGVEALLSAAARMLAPGGRLITLDGCRRRTNSAVIKWLLNHDRGRHIREEGAYLELFSRHFQIEAVDSDPSAMNIPYSVFSVIARSRHDNI